MSIVVALLPSALPQYSNHESFSFFFAAAACAPGLVSSTISGVPGLTKGHLLPVAESETRPGSFIG